MPQPSPPGQASRPSPPHRHFTRLHVLLIVVGLLLAAIAGVSWWVLRFIDEDLTPLVAEELSKTLNRPVKMGDVQNYSLTHIRFGPSEIPACSPQQGCAKEDADSAKMEAVDIRFNLLPVLWSRKLPLEATLIKPQLYLDQTQDGEWIATRLRFGPSKAWIKVKLNQLRVQQGTAQIEPANIEARQFSQLNGTLNFSTPETLYFNTQSQVDSGGQLSVKGAWQSKQKKLEVNAQTKDLVAAPLMGLLPKLPFEINKGQLQGQFQVKLRPQHPVTIHSDATLSQGDIWIPRQAIRVQANNIRTDVRIEVLPQRPVELKGEAYIDGARADVPEDLILDNRRQRPRRLSQLQGTVDFLGLKQRFRFDLKGRMGQTGRLKARGTASFLEQQTNMRLQLQNLPAPLFDQAFQLPITADSGQVSASIRVKLRPKQRPDVQGTALLKRVEMGIVNVPQPFSRVRGFLRFKGIAVRLEGLKGDYGQIPMQATGWIDPDRGYSLVGQTEWVAAQPTLETLQVTGLPFPVTGQFKGDNLRFDGAIDQPIFSGSVQLAKQPKVDRVPFKQLTAQFQLADALLKMEDIKAEPTVGGQFRGTARFNVEPGGQLLTQLEASNIPGNGIAQSYQADPGFPLGPLQGQIKIFGPPDDIRTNVDFQALKGQFPTRGNIFVRDSVAQLRRIVTQIPGGELRTQGQIKDNRINVTTTTSGVALKAYTPDARGQMTGQLKITGPFDRFSVNTARAQGQARFSDGIAIVYDPIAAQLRWDGQQILVDQATAPGFWSQGQVGLDFDTPQGPQLTTLNLAVRSWGYDLGLFPPFGPTQVKMAGRANLVGQLTGTVADPYLDSTVQINNLLVGGIPFENQLKGKMLYGQQAKLDLRVSGQRDRINLALNSNQLPTAFDIRRDQAWAKGRTEQGKLNLAFQDVPLAALNWQPVDNLGPISGLSSGKFSLNPTTYAGHGTLAVTRPALGKLVGDQFLGRFQLTSDTIRLQQGELRDRNNLYQLQANVIPGINPKFSGTLNIRQTEIADLVAAATSLNLNPSASLDQPRGKAKDVETLPIGSAQGSLMMQLRRLSELDALATQQQADAPPDPLFPDLNELSGKLAGRLQFSGSLQSGLDTRFALQSEALKWGDYAIDRITAQGQYTDGSLKLRPLLVATGEQEAKFQGTIGLQQQSGQLTLKNLPLQGLNQFLDLPFEVAGTVNGTATLAGTLADPRLQGELNWDEARVNTLALNQARTTFAYNRGRLTFEGGSEALPFRFTGNIPYQLPLTAVGPDSDALEVSLKVKDDGLSLINLFTDQLNWVEGQGEIDLNVTGTLTQPSMQGSIQLNQATLTSNLLFEPLTNVTGTIQFDRNQLRINRLIGLYSQGELEASGSLPLFVSEPPPSSASLQLALKALKLNVKGLYKGQIDGDLNISGSLLAPQLGGVMALTNGQVILADVNVASSSTSGQFGQTTPLEFNNLQVQLNNNVRVTQPPLLSFVAAGNVTVNGSVNAPRPAGKIRFRQGSVNLFTSRFRIDSRRDNFAEFDPSLGLDPFLSIGMVTTATDIAGGRATELNEFEDLPAGRIGAIESVRVRATVEGRASELVNNFNQVVQLTSTPSRSEGEILALLGGSVTNNLEDGNTELALVNLASSAFLTGFEGLFSDALGTRASFRLFPVLIPNDDQDQSVLAFGAELGYDVTDRFSVSALQILTGLDEATLFNASYDINEQLRVRSAISTDGEAVGILEYRIRF
ncbi:translocation/assembly module TamB domain-containing protein [Acaryochloris sp. CCMEE 5410]|uniref:translocation/assembly module TamB domain-containing protein n=1 Tax=Acaryochloris sp. CCMEE 5410 TaxID=310037 RepID=UPI000248467A|nr:translocation/assembly module TamB domain-containing protein [Acaryochloris sp. CCMEE 5410]KAI9130856.1 translocation/assembly module TamB domain-containing protein [Acaryochloris sp. CCMEE 5410]